MVAWEFEVRDMTMNIMEDNQLDKNNYKKAYDIFHDIISFLLKVNPEKLELRRLDGKIYLVFRGKDAGLSGEESKLWFFFGLYKHNDFGPSGAISRFMKSKDFVIFINCLDEMPSSYEDIPKILKSIIYSNPVHEIIIHELIHYFDNLRYAEEFVGNKEKDKFKSYDTDKKTYYNNPWEFNAYSNNIFSSIFHILDLIGKHGDDSLDRLKKQASAQGIVKSPTQTLKNLIDNKYSLKSNLTKFLDNLTPERKKSFYKRFYRLHKELVEKLGL